jgi:putative FmdB family regulatory protein
MPTYDYACEACGHEFERFESITAAPSKTCPKCKKSKAKRLISAGGGFLFKGSGFYVTDYKKSGVSKSCPSANDSKACKECPGSEPKAAKACAAK